MLKSVGYEKEIIEKSIEELIKIKDFRTYFYENNDLSYEKIIEQKNNKNKYFFNLNYSTFLGSRLKKNNLQGEKLEKIKENAKKIITKLNTEFNNSYDSFIIFEVSAFGNKYIYSDIIDTSTTTNLTNRKSYTGGEGENISEKPNKIFKNNNHVYNIMIIIFF